MQSVIDTKGEFCAGYVGPTEVPLGQRSPLFVGLMSLGRTIQHLRGGEKEPMQGGDPTGQLQSRASLSPNSHSSPNRDATDPMNFSCAFIYPNDKRKNFKDQQVNAHVSQSR